LHMAQLMPLPLTVSCFSKIQIGFTFLVPADLGSPGKRAVKRVCVCVCVCVCCYVGVRPLHLAVEGGHEDIVSCLIEHGCNVNEPSFDGTTPLHIACECGHLTIVCCSVSFSSETSTHIAIFIHTVKFHKGSLLWDVAEEG